LRKPVRSRGYGLLMSLLSEVRQEAGLNQRQLAELLKVPRSVVSKVETGERRIDPMECAEWAQACGLKPQLFFARFARALERRQ
jgi:transcriptional regulator with XRE-family HTH domain